MRTGARRVAVGWTSELAVAGAGILGALGIWAAFGDPGVFVVVDGDVAVDETGFEGSGIDGNRVRGDLDGAVDVLPFTAVDGELPGEGGGEGDVVPAFLGVGGGDGFGGVRIATRVSSSSVLSVWVSGVVWRMLTMLTGSQPSTGPAWAWRGLTGRRAKSSRVTVITTGGASANSGVPGSAQRNPRSTFSPLSLSTRIPR